VFEDLSTAQLEEVEDELFRFTRTVADTPSLRAAMANGDLPLDVRQGLVRQLLEGKVEAATLQLVEYTLAGGRPRDLVGTLDWLVEETAKARGWRVARVRSARTLADDERETLAQSLTQLSGHPVELQVTVEPELLAGVVVEVGDRRLEATARDRLDQLREHMGGAAWEDRLNRPSDAA
jgi:F-type H+-transporting ATPase subunit delta